MSIVTFAVEHKDVEGRIWAGTFDIKTRISRRDVIRQDEIERSILGGSPQTAGAYARSLAEIISYLRVRITKAPKWWTDADGGLELESDDVLVAVNNAAVKAVEADLKKVLDAAEAAKTEIRSELPK